MCVFVWVFNLISLIVFMPMPCCFYYSSSTVQFEIGAGNTSSNSFIIQDYFSYPGICVCVCVLPYEADNCPSTFCEKLCWNFDWAVLDL